jgi:hypothetical protein
MDLILSLLNETFIIYRLHPNQDIPEKALNASFFAVTRTDEELSLVLPESVRLECEKSEPGWACFKVDGPLAFELVGILAGISTVLAEAGVSIFALSTFDTDYVLVKREQVGAAKEALSSAGYQINPGEE